jgi:PKD repeat protein
MFQYLAAAISINVAKPVAYFTFNHTNPGCGAPMYQFNNLSTGAVSYLWSFGYNQFSTQVNPVKNLGYPDTIQLP